MFDPVATWWELESINRKRRPSVVLFAIRTKIVTSLQPATPRGRSRLMQCEDSFHRSVVKSTMPPWYIPNCAPGKTPRTTPGFTWQLILITHYCLIVFVVSEPILSTMLTAQIIFRWIVTAPKNIPFIPHMPPHLW